MTDLVFLEQGNSDYVIRGETKGEGEGEGEGKKLVNFLKRMQWAKIIQFIQSFQVSIFFYKNIM